MVLAATLCTGDCAARTWTVEKDGSGDFTVIQDAVDAAAPGDTIMIGPGRFDDRPYYETATHVGRIAAVIEKSRLTLVGSGPDQTIIGPAAPDYIMDGKQTIGVFFVRGRSSLELTRLSVENVNIGVAVLSSGLAARDCGFHVYGQGGVQVAAPVGSLTVEDCQFSTPGGGGVNVAIGAAVGATADNVVVQRSSFVGQLGSGLVTWSGNGLLLEDCEFTGFRSGLGIRAMSDATIRRCVVANNIGGVALFASEGSEIRVLDSEFDGSAGEVGVRVTGSTVELESCLIRGGTRAAVRPDALGDYHFRNCRVERQPGTLFVESYLRSDITERIDMRYNWWGTTDSTTIASGILDGRTADPQECIDNPTLYYCPRDTVDFWPALDEPPFVPTAKNSVGRMKARFNRD